MTQAFEFGDFRLELEERRLFFKGEGRSLPPKLFDTLALLVQKPDRLITKDEFLNLLWPDTFVGEDTLAQNISLLRKVLSEGANGQEYVATVPRRGYRFVARVTTKPVVGRPISESAPEVNPAGHGHQTSKSQAGVVSPSPSKSQHLSAPRIETRVFPLGWIRIAAVSSIVGLSAGVATVLVVRPVAQNPMKALSFLLLTNDARPKTGPLRTDGTRIYATEYLPDLHGVIVQVSIKGGEITPFSSPLRKPRVADISPDGTELLLMNDELTGPPSLWIQSVIGGDPRRVGDLAADDASWGPDDQTIAYSKSQEIYVAKKDGTLSRKLLTVPGVPFDLKFSPDGTKLRFTLAEGQDKTTSLWEASADGSHPRSLLPDWNAAGSECCGVWTTDGKYYVFQTSQNARREIWAIQENGSTGLRRTRLVPQQVTAGPMDFSYPIAGKDGRELFAIGTLPRAEVVRYDLREHQFIPYLPGISAEGLDFSQDGKWVTYASYPEATLWRSRIDGSDRRQLTFAPMRVFLPRWSPDGKQIAFLGGPPGGRWKLGGPWKIYLISIDGGSPQQLLPGQTNESDPTWSADGNSIVFGGLPWPETSGENHADMNIQVVELKTRQPSKLPGSDGLFSPRWSPDGRYIVAFTSSHPMGPLLFSLATKKWTRLLDGDMGYPSWSRDSKYIYLQDWNHARPRILRARLSDHRVEVLMEFSDVKRPMVGFITPWSGVALDGSPLVARDISNQEIYALKLHVP